MQQQKKIPLRQCLGCREHKAKKELIRVVRTPEGLVLLDLKGKANGRGAYVCPKKSCMSKALKSKAISRALSCEIPPELAEELLSQLSEEP